MANISAEQFLGGKPAKVISANDFIGNGTFKVVSETPATPAPTSMLQDISTGVAKTELGFFEKAGQIVNKIRNAIQMRNLPNSQLPPLPTDTTLFSQGGQGLNNNPNALDYKNTTEAISGNIASLAGQLLVAPEVAVEKLGIGGLTFLAEHNLLTENALHAAGKFIVSKWGTRAFTVLNDFVVGAGLKTGENIATGESGGVVKSGAETAVGGAILRPVIRGAGALVDKISGKNIGEVATNVKNLITSPYTKIKSALRGKTEAEILATPPDQLYKLNPSERAIYKDSQTTGIERNTQSLSDVSTKRYEAQKQQLSDNFVNNKNQTIDEFKKAQIALDTQYANEQNVIKKTHETTVSQAEQKLSAIETKVKADLQAKADASVAEATKLQRQFDVANRDETLALRPKTQEALGRQSQEWRRLTDEELAPVKNNPVEPINIKTYIENTYSADPEKAKAILNRFGFSESGHFMNGEVETTVGKLHDQVLSLGQDIGTAARKGTRVFTPEEKLTDDAISTLVGFLKTQGYDAVKARQFWARYAPVRDQLVSSAKIFNQAGTRTGGFAKTLADVISGKDVNNENFIKEVEKLINEPLGTKGKTILQKMSTNEKIALVNKVDAEMKIVNAKIAKETAVTTSKQTLETSQKNLDDAYTKAKANLDKAKVETERNATAKNKENVLKLKAEAEKYAEALKDSKTMSLDQLKSKWIEIERKAKTRDWIKKVLFGTAVTGVGFGAEEVIRRTLFH